MSTSPNTTTIPTPARVALRDWLRTARTAAFLVRDIERAWQRAADDIRRRFVDAINGVPVATAYQPRTRKRRKRVR